MKFELKFELRSELTIAVVQWLWHDKPFSMIEMIFNYVSI